MDIPYDLIHKLENQYGTMSNVPENDPLMIELHQKIGIKNIKHTSHRKRYKRHYVPHYYDDEIIELNKKGYSINEINYMTKRSNQTISNILHNFGLKTKDPYIGIYKGIYISSLQNLLYWGIKARNAIEVNRKTNQQFATKRYHWCDLSEGDKFMIRGNNTEIFTK